MPGLRVSVVLPYYLRLDEGEYEMAQGEESLHVAAPLLLESTPPRTPISAHFTPEDSADADEIQRRRARCAGQLLRRINRLLRWYRTVSRRADITEVNPRTGKPVFVRVIGRGGTRGMDVAT